jgi:hypothetical protein
LYIATACLVARGQETQYGKIEGIVLEENGAPLKDAWVFICTIANPPYAQTGEDGRFVLDHVPASDDHAVCAYKESEGYPYNLFSFYNMPRERMPHVAVRAGQVATGVVVQLGAKAAKLKFNISDENGAAVAASLTFSRPDLDLARPEIKDYGAFNSSVPLGGEIMVPPVPFRLTVHADGFAPWHYGGADWLLDSGLIKLRSGETMTLNVQLRHLK